MPTIFVKKCYDDSICYIKYIWIEMKGREYMIPTREEAKAYVLGLLHDVGRKFGRCQLKHVYAGWQYMLQLGYDEVARICLTHSFPVKQIGVYIGKFDIDEEQQSEIERVYMT